MQQAATVSWADGPNNALFSWYYLGHCTTGRASRKAIQPNALTLKAFVRLSTMQSSRRDTAEPTSLWEVCCGQSARAIPLDESRHHCLAVLRTRLAADMASKSRPKAFEVHPVASMPLAYILAEPSS